MSKVTVKFVREKDTKNTVRYKEVEQEGQAPVIGSLYVAKCHAGSCTELEITIDKKD